MNFFKYFIANEVDSTLLKYFLMAYGLKKRNLRIIKRETKEVPVADIIDKSSEKWADALELYQDFLKKHTQVGMKNTALWRHELKNAKGNTKRVEKRLKEYISLFKSISGGFSSTRANMIRLLKISKMPPLKKEFITARFSKKYYRLTGMKRCIICNYLGIKKIKARILTPKVVQI